MINLDSGATAIITQRATLTIPEDHPDNANRDEVVIQIRVSWSWDNQKGWQINEYGKRGVIRKRLKSGGLGKAQERQWLSTSGSFQDIEQAARPTSRITVTEQED